MKDKISSIQGLLREKIFGLYDSLLRSHLMSVFSESLNFHPTKICNLLKTVIDAHYVLISDRL